MSLIHEALKKAEAQRRLGEPPTLGTPLSATRRRRPLLPVFGALIAVALGAGWWLSSRNTADTPQAAAPGDLAPAPATAQPPAYNQPTKTTGPRVNETAQSSAAERHPVGSPNPSQPPGSRGIGAIAPVTGPINQAPPPRPVTPQELAERESEPHPAGANPLAPGEAAPVALGAPPPATAPNDPAALAAKQKTKEQAGQTVAVAPAPPAGSAPTGAAPASAAPANAPVKSVITKPAPPPAAPAAAPVAAASSPAKPAAPAASPPVAAPPPAAVPPAAAQPVAQAPQQPALEQLPLFWQLPLNVRKDLPALKLSMHVYSPTPAQRFVILNGNRQKEGDDLGADVRLNEIRVDGAVLEFHGQRFLVPRGGS